MIRFLLPGALLLLALMFAACSEQASEPLPEFDFKITYTQDDDQLSDVWPERSLKQAFMTYWDARFEQDLDKAWSMEAPHLRFIGSENNYKRFHSRGSGQILTEIAVSRVDKAHDNMYRVINELRFSQFGRDQSAHIADTWVKVEDRWYHLERNPFVFPGSL